VEVSVSLLVLVLAGWVHAQEAPAPPAAPAAPTAQAPWPYGYPYPWPYPTPPTAAPAATPSAPLPATGAAPEGDLPPECKPIRLGTAKEIEKLMTELHATGRTQLAFVGNAVVCGWR
jgi:hypothetical protein